MNDEARRRNADLPGIAELCLNHRYGGGAHICVLAYDDGGVLPSSIVVRFICSPASAGNSSRRE